MLGEMVVDFRTAVKRSVVDYILRSPVERRRVNILHPPRAGEYTRQKVQHEQKMPFAEKKNQKMKYPHAVG